jgi:hypothetical protein
MCLFALLRAQLGTVFEKVGMPDIALLNATAERKRAATGEKNSLKSYRVFT